MLATPGVYIEEIDGLSLSISSSLTAVPVFALPHSDNVPWWDEIEKPLRINSFTEFERYAAGTASIPSQNARSLQLNMAANIFWPRGRRNSWRWPTLASLAKTSGVSTFGEGIQWDQPLAPALRAYFENGGGYCYICPYDKLVDFVPGMSDVTLVVQAGVPDATAPIQQICTPGSMKFGLLDGPRVEKLEDVYGDMDASDSTAIYYPWLAADWRVNGPDGFPIDKKDIHLVAPSAVVAGLMCTVDRERGVWKAPANVAVKGGLRPVVKVGNRMQDTYTQPNKIAVNMIRDFEGRGTQVWGARTMTVSGSSWLYIPVRRLFDMAERDIKSALQSVVFEPNGPATWEIVRASVDNYLFNLWRLGAFSGASPQLSYFVRVGAGITMSQHDIEAGILRVSIGLAAVRPAEYIVLEFTQQVASGAQA
ncbi:phage tail sheath family protein [Serratia marcescens]|uniref:phage tail sheath family protein n=1 Tax=Serratia marcescens TaxID=615 RepID=UPI003FA77518